MLERDIILYEADYLPTPGDNNNFISLGGWLFDLSLRLIILRHVRELLKDGKSSLQFIYKTS